MLLRADSGRNRQSLECKAPAEVACVAKLSECDSHVRLAPDGLQRTTR